MNAGDAAMNWASALTFIGIAIMAISVERMGFKIGVTWEVAGFAAGILLTAAGGVLPMEKRIDDLEKRVSALVNRNGQ
jgi:predicted cobalt transporter CbtA